MPLPRQPSPFQMKTTNLKQEEVEIRWYVYDASEHALGRMASKIAMQLMGKDRPQYTPNQLTGAHVVVVNAGGARLSGKKNEQKVYMSYSGYAGGLKTTSLDYVRENRPIDIVREAVRRMLPKNRIGREMLRNLKVYAGTEHPHQAQAPDNKVEATL
jgi:large subunit ribosomal protein L13